MGGGRNARCRVPGVGGTSPTSTDVLVGLQSVCGNAVTSGFELCCAAMRCVVVFITSVVRQRIAQRVVVYCLGHDQDRNLPALRHRHL